MEILSLGQKIKLKRKELDMTLKDLAKDRITPGQISLVESGRSNPSMDLLEYLANNLGITVEYLMESEESQAEKICMYFEQVAETYILSGKQEEALDYLDKALSYVNQYKLETRLAKILFLKAKVLRKKNEIEEAQKILLTASTIFLREENYQEVIKTFLLIADISLDIKAYHAACTYLKQGEVLYIDKALNNYSLIGSIYYKLALIYYKTEKLEEAKKYAYLAKKEFEYINNKEEYAMSLLETAINFEKNEDINNGILYSTRALELLKDVDNQSGISSTYNDLGELFSKLEEVNEAELHLVVAKRLIVAENDMDKLIDTKISLCRTHLKLKNIDKCEKYIRELLDKIDKKDVKRIIEVNLLKYRIFTINEELVEAEKILIDSYNLAINNNEIKIAGEISIKISKFYMENKKEEAAKEFLDVGVKILKSLKIIHNN